MRPKEEHGKKPKGSGRRLYTDENPKDTVTIKFATPAMLEQLLQKLNESASPLQEKYKSSQLVSKERRLWVRARWRAYLKEARMRSERRRRFNGKLYRVSNLKEGPYKKSLVKKLMSARRMWVQL